MNLFQSLLGIHFNWNNETNARYKRDGLTTNLESDAGGELFMQLSALMGLGTG